MSLFMTDTVTSQKYWPFLLNHPYVFVIGLRFTKLPVDSIHDTVYVSKSVSNNSACEFNVMKFIFSGNVAQSCLTLEGEGNSTI